MRSDHVRLFQTLPHACGYFAGRTAQNLVIDPAAPQFRRVDGTGTVEATRAACLAALQS